MNKRSTVPALMPETSRGSFAAATRLKFVLAPILGALPVSALLMVGTPALAAPPAVPGPRAVERSQRHAEDRDAGRGARAVRRRAFAAAKALRPSVVRIDVESGAPRVARAPQGSANCPRGVFRIFKHFSTWSGEGPACRGDRAAGPVRESSSTSRVTWWTNRHAYEGASKVTVTMWEGQSFGQGHRRRSRTDVAVVRLEKVPTNPSPRGWRFGAPDVGDMGMRSGSPLGLEQTVTAGIISGKGRAGTTGSHVRRIACARTFPDRRQDHPENSGDPWPTSAERSSASTR